MSLRDGRGCKGTALCGSPGSDHASIATEVKVVNKIREEEGLSKEDLGEKSSSREPGHGRRIRRQDNQTVPQAGDSCDWSRERFTMDEGCSKAVKHSS